MRQEARASSSADEQLCAIAHVSSVLDHHGIEHWLFGGWAVDFWAGAVTRAHDDVDVAAWRHDYDTVKMALTTAGWRHTPAEAEVVGTRYRRGRALVEFTFVVADAEDRIVIPFADGPVVWSTAPFGDHRRELHGISARVLPLDVLKAGKASPLDGAAEAAKDRADFEALSSLA